MQSRWRSDTNQEYQVQGTCASTHSGSLLKFMEAWYHAFHTYCLGYSGHLFPFPPHGTGSHQHFQDPACHMQELWVYPVQTFCRQTKFHFMSTSVKYLIGYNICYANLISKKSLLSKTIPHVSYITLFFSFIRSFRSPNLIIVACV